MHFLFHLQEDACEDGTADTVPGTADGARQYGKRLGSEEVAGKDGGKSCVLHTHLNADGALLGFAEACQPTCSITQEIT